MFGIQNYFLQVKIYNSKLMVCNRLVAGLQFIVTGYFGKLFFNILALAVLVSFFACKKTSDPSPNPEPVVTKFPFEIQLVFPEVNKSNPQIEVNPNEVIKLFFRLTSDERISLIDFQTKDHRKGERSLEDYPYAIGNSYRETFPLNSKFQQTNTYVIYVTQQIRIPSYAKDSIIITVKAVKTDLSTKSFKLLLKVKKEIDFQIVNCKLNNEPISGSPIRLFFGGEIYDISGSVNTSRTLVKVKAALWVNNLEKSTRTLNFTENRYDNYGNIRFSYNDINASTYYLFPNRNSLFQLNKDLIGKNVKFKITAFVDSGDSTALEIPIEVAFKDLITAGPFNLGGPRNQNYGQFFYSLNPSPTVAINPNLNISYGDPYSMMGYFQQGGANRLGSFAYLFPLRTSLGYVFQNNYNNVFSRTYFKKVSDAFESIDAYYLDTVNINATDPEVISLKPNDVIVFINNSQKAQKGFLKIHNIVPGDSGSVTLSCKYEKL